MSSVSTNDTSPDSPIDTSKNAPVDASLSLSERARIIEALVFASSEPFLFKKLSPYINEETELGEIIDIIKSRYD